MKFTSAFAVLLATASAFANVIPSDASAECQKEFTDKLRACYELKGDLSAFCNKECDEFYSNPAKFVPSCVKSGTISEDQLKYDRLHRKMACSKDESGKQCPVGAYVTGKDSNIDKLVNDTCASSACTQATIEYYKTLAPITKPADAVHMRDRIEILSKSECKAKQGKSSSSSDNKKTDDKKSEEKKSDDKKTSSSNGNGSSTPAASGATSGANPAPANTGIPAPAVNGTTPATNSTTPAGAATTASSDATTTKVGTTLMVSLGLLLLSYF